MILQYLLFEILMEEERRSNSPAILFGMLIPTVLVPFPTGFVVIFFSFFGAEPDSPARPVSS